MADNVRSTRNEYVVAEWSESPFTAYDRRGDRVLHRVRLLAYGGAGVDVVHEVKDEERQDEWVTKDAYEARQHGIRKESKTSEWWS